MYLSLGPPRCCLEWAKKDYEKKLVNPTGDVVKADKPIQRFPALNLTAWNQVRELELNCSELKEFPAQLAQLPNLVKFELSDITPPATLQGIEAMNLRELAFSRCDFGDCSVTLPTSIVTLRITWGKLKRLPSLLSNRVYSYLTTLHWVGCDADTEFGDAAQLPALRYLYLSHGHLTHIPRWMCDVGNHQLVELSLNSNDLSEIPADLIFSQPRLQSLSLNDNKLIKTLPVEITHLQELHTLKLGYIYQLDLPPQLSTLVSLRYLRISNDRMLKPELYALNLTTLETDKLEATNWSRIQKQRLSPLYIAQRREPHSLLQIAVMWINGHRSWFPHTDVLPLPEELKRLLV